MSNPLCNTVLCDQCQNIFYGNKRISDGFGANQYYDHWSEYELVQGASRNGCGICKMLCFHFIREPQNRPSEKLELRCCLRTDLSVPNSIYIVIFLYRAWPPKVLTGQDSSNGVNYNIKSKKISVSRASDIETLLSSRSEVDEFSTASGKGWALVLRWMHHCLRHHPRCNTWSMSEWWPTRLLEIESQSDARLIETSENLPSGPYLTLSHRWGSAEFITLTTENMATMKAGVSYKRFPKTFQDVVTIAKRFKIRYIWIDSMCIIQNSREDWQNQASLMSEVYRNAFCNIAATGAVDSTEGLFFRRDLNDFLPCKITSPSDMAAEPLYALDPDMWRHHVTQAPLIQRAWVVQERLLSKRVVHFGRHQIMWECREKEACEIFPTGLPFDRDLKSINDHSEDDHEHQTNGKFDGGLSWNWHRVVLHYSGRELTKESDKEAAISGVTTFMGGKLNDTCIAGLWKKNLLVELLWSIGNNEVATRPKEYRAPSWSWLSINGTVSTRVIHSNIVWRKFFAVVEDIQIQRTEVGLLAPIKAGLIKLRGCLREAAWEYRPNEDLHHILILNGRRLSNSQGYCTADRLLSTAPEKIWCLIIELSLNREETLERSVLSGRGLILRQVENTKWKRFERIGTFSIDGEEVVEILLSPFMKDRSLAHEQFDPSDGRDMQLGDSYPVHLERKESQNLYNTISTTQRPDRQDIKTFSDVTDESSDADRSSSIDAAELARLGQLRELFEALEMKDLETTSVMIV